MRRDEARLLELLLSNRAFRRRFANDPATVAREAGFAELADDLAGLDGRDAQRLGVREPRSSAAGAFLAAAVESLDLFDFGDSGGGSVAEPPPTTAPSAPSAAPDSTGPDPAAEADPAPSTSPPPDEPIPAVLDATAPAPSSVAGAFPAVTAAQVEADRAAQLVANAQADAIEQSAKADLAALSPDPDDWEGNLDDEDGGADEVDGSNEDEPDEGGGEDDDSAADNTGSGQQSGAGTGAETGSDEEGSDEEGSDEEGSDGEDEEADEDENEGQDEIGEGSRGEDANDDESDESDGSDESDSADESSGDGNDSSDDTSDDTRDASGDTSASDDGGGLLAGAPDEYPGDDAPREDIAAWMATKAEDRGLPPELPIMTSLVESGMRNLDYGDADSVGLFQMRLSIWNNGEYSGYSDDPDLQLKWFLDHAEAVKKQRLERGLPVDDPNEYGEWIADVQIPAEQYRGRYQERLAEAQELLVKARAKYGGDDSGDAANGDGGDAGDATGAVDPGSYDSVFDLAVGGAKWTNLGGPEEHHERALGNWQSDDAWDLGVPVGTPVYATDDGTIGPLLGPMESRPGDGERLTLNGSENNYWYGHLSEIVVHAGDEVKAGQLLGYSGASQNGVPHLHIGVEYMDRLPEFDVGSAHKH